MSTGEIVVGQIVADVLILVAFTIYALRNPNTGSAGRSRATGIALVAICTVMGVSLWLQHQNQMS